MAVPFTRISTGPAAIAANQIARPRWVSRRSETVCGGRPFDGAALAGYTRQERPGIHMKWLAEFSLIKRHSASRYLYDNESLERCLRPRGIHTSTYDCAAVYPIRQYGCIVTALV